MPGQQFGVVLGAGLACICRKKESKGGDAKAAAEEQPAASAEEEVDENGDRKNRKGMDLATTLERIQKNFVITDPRLPDNPIVSAP